MEINASFLIAVLGCGISVATFFLGRVTAAKNSGQAMGVLMTDIGYIKSSVDDVKKKMEQDDNRYMDLSNRVTALEQKMDLYHKGHTT